MSCSGETIEEDDRLLQINLNCYLQVILMVMVSMMM